MAAFVIFVGGAGTEPDPLPVFFLGSGEHAVRICEGIAATEYRIYKFTCHEVSKSDLSKFPFWTEMTIDARDGVYGEIAAGIYNMIQRAYSIIDQRRVHKEPVSNPNGIAESDGDSVSQSTATEKPTETDDKLSEMIDESPPPQYDPNSVDWILSETLCDVINIKARTIADYRKPGKCGEDRIDKFGSWNVDCIGKFRRQVNRKGSVAYYRPAMSSAYTAKLEYAESQKRQKP